MARQNALEKATGKQFSKEEYLFIKQLVSNYNRAIRKLGEKFGGNSPKALTMSDAGDMIKRIGVGKTIAILATQKQVEKARGRKIGNYTITENTNSYLPTASEMEETIEVMNERIREENEASDYVYQTTNERMQELKNAYRGNAAFLRENPELDPDKRRELLIEQGRIRSEQGKLIRKMAITNQADPLFKQNGVPSPERLAAEMTRARRGYDKETSVILSNIEQAMKEIGHTREKTSLYLAQVQRLLTDEATKDKMDNEALGELLKSLIEGVYNVESAVPQGQDYVMQQIEFEIRTFLEEHLGFSPEAAEEWATDVDSRALAAEDIMQMIQGGGDILKKDDDSYISWF